MPRRLPRRRIVRKRKVNRRKGGNRIPRSIATAGKGQMARIVETIEFADQKPNELFQCAFNLAQFPRASQLATNFAFYKAARVTWQYEPLFNTFQDGAGAASKPYLYVVMNRGQVSLPFNPQNPAAIPFSIKNIQATGAKPVGLSGTRKITYVPNWCSPGLTAVAQFTNNSFDVSMGLQPQYKWLSTRGWGAVFNTTGQQIDGATMANYTPIGTEGVDPGPLAVNPKQVASSAVVYNGHNTWIDQAFVGSSTEEPTCRLTCTVEWVYKGAIFNQPLGPASTPGEPTVSA